MRHIFLGKTFPRMRSKGSRFTLGVWGLRVCSLDVAQPFATARNSQQPFATARNRLQPSATARKRSHEVASAHGKFCSRGHFWRFHVSRSDISFFLRGRRNIFATFSEDEFQSSWQVQHFGDLHRHFAWQAQHFRGVALRVFCESHCQGCLKW